MSLGGLREGERERREHRREERERAESTEEKRERVHVRGQTRRLTLLHSQLKLVGGEFTEAVLQLYNLERYMQAGM